MKSQFVAFTFPPSSSEDEYKDCQSDTSEYPSAISTENSFPSPSSIRRPPFFRTRNPKTPLYPSRCYALPPAGCMYARKAVEKRADGTEVLFPKDPSKCIQFVGVNAVSFNENNPSTLLTPLSNEECDRIFHKEEREAITIIEDEETLRNDSLLDTVDDMDEDSDIIPISRLRQFIRNDMGKVIPNKRFSTLGTPIRSPLDAIPARPVPQPKFFTFDEVSEIGDDSVAESLTPERDTGFFSSPHLEGIASVRDSLSSEADTPFRRLSIKELDMLSSQQSVGSQKEGLRSPRLSICQTPVSIAQTPRCLTGKIGAATVTKDGVSFFVAPKESEGDPKNSSLSSEVERRLSLTRQVDSIRRFCKEKMESMKSFQKSLQKVLDTKSPVLEKDYVINAIHSVLSSIDNAQYNIKMEMFESIAVESEYHLLKDGYPKTELWLMTMKKESMEFYSMELHMYGLTVLEMLDNVLCVRLECDNSCSLDIRLSTSNYSSVTTTLSVNTNGSKLFEGIVQNSGLYSVFRKEIHFHELHDYFHIIWCFCMRAKMEYRRRLRE
ncbi:hypothetical protein WA577_007126 [Blastocystis sp. JDR]